MDDCKTVTVDWTTADGTATAGEDYAAASGTLTFGPGETSKTIRVALLDTADVDGTETFSVQLGNASGITLDDAEAIGTISGAETANVPATGQPTVTGTARVGEMLTASASDIADDDGLTNATFAWQWIADDADIAGATEATYTLTSAEEGKTVKVRATFTDDRDTEETVLSDATAAVTTAYTCTAPNLAGRTEVWTGTLTVATVERGGAVIGYGFNREPTGGGNYGNYRRAVRHELRLRRNQLRHHRGCPGYRAVPDSGAGRDAGQVPARHRAEDAAAACLRRHVRPGEREC